MRTAPATVPSRRVEADSDVHAPWDAPLDRDARQAWVKARRLSAVRLHEVQTLLGTASPAASSTTLNPQQWTSIGPQPIGTSTNPDAGSVLNLAMDLHNPGTIYAGTYVGKLWKTTNSGTTWLPLSDTGPLVDVQWIAVDPVALNTVYVLDAGSIYKSADGGSTWTELPPVVTDASLKCSGEAFAIHPSVSATWLVSEYCSASPSTSVIYKTTNAGAAWSRQATIAGEIDKLEFNASSPNYTYAAGFASSSVLFEISTDTGTTWTSAPGSGSTALPQSAQYAPNVVGFASAPSSPKTIYLQVDSSADPDVISMFKTADGGLTWNALTSFLAAEEKPRTPGVTAVDPTNPNTVFAGAILLERSTDGGVTWAYADGSGTNTRLHSDNHAMVFTPDGNTVFESNDGGVWTSTSFRSASVTWKGLNQTFGTAEFYAPLGMDPTNPNRSFGGLQDNGTIMYSGNLAWAEAGILGDGYGTVINPVNTNIVYAVSNVGGIYRSTAGGAAGTFALLPTSPITFGNLVMDFTTPTTLYAFQGPALFQSLDGGNTWPKFGPPDNNTVDGLAVAPSDSNTVVAVLAGGAVPWITKNAQSGAAAWRAGLPLVTVSSSTNFEGIAIDPANPNQLYALQGNGTSAAPLLTSSDGGMSLQARNFGPNVVDIPRALVVDPDLPNTMYLGTASSVFRSSDGGASWYPLASGFPLVNITSLNLHRGARILRAGTTGRGIWDLAVPTTAPRLSSASLTAASSGFKLTVNGSNFTANSAIWLNGNPLATSFSSSTQLTAAVPTSSITPSTVCNVSVNTPGSGGGLADPILTSNGPTIYPDGVQNAAGPVSVTSDSATNSFTVGLSPGMFVALYGSQLATAPVVAPLPFPTMLGGVKVLVNGTAAPLYYVSANQIDFVVPWETAGTVASVAVVSGGTTSNTVATPIQTAPQIFTTNQAGSGQGAVLVAGTATIAAPTGAFPGSRPAAKGEYISIYMAGLGPVQNPPSDGAIDTVLSSTVAQPAVRIGCPGSSGLLTFCNAPVQFSGLAPGFVGLYQVNVQIPADAMSGSVVPLQITFAAGAGRPSNIVTIAVQ
ncbi:MAG TPA: IPT/TIG domain-containing protein [Bryobacteraceae bacterium]|nr:IPT/TIG domain-containing protein [Bryobacteraceae bacterium]